MMKRIITLIMALMLATAFYATAQTYHSDDKEGLRIFLRQPSAEAGKINGEQVGLQLSDTLNWQTSEEWVSKVEGLIWNEQTPKRLIKIGEEYYAGWYYKHLTGKLDAGKWTMLTDLNCHYNGITALDVSKNTALVNLNFNVNSLTVLDVSKNTALLYLACGYNQLTSLDVSKNIALTGLHCGGNQWSTIDVSKNTQLQYLYCNGSKLTTLDISKNTTLYSLYCDWNQLTTLDITKNVVLEDLQCNNNQLNALDISKNTFLYNLYCQNNAIPLGDLYMASQQISYVDSKHLGTQTLPSVSIALNTPVLVTNDLVLGGVNTVFTVKKGNDPAVLNTDYTLSGGTITFKTNGIYTVEQTNDAITSHPDYPAKVIATYIAGNVEKQSITFTWKGSTNGKSFSVKASANRQFTVNWGDGNSDTFNGFGSDYYDEVILTHAYANSNVYMVTVTGVNADCFFTSLNLSYDYSVSTLDVSNAITLKVLQCHYNQLTILDVSQNPALTELYCASNQLTSLDVSKNIVLNVLLCNDNLLNTLDISKNTVLNNLFCERNQLASLDVSKNTALSNLSCSDNQLKVLDVSKNLKLNYLYCGSNQLASLDVSKNTALSNLSCFDNQLKVLDVSKNLELNYLYCGSNQLKTLDVSKNTTLYSLSCENNQLTSLDITKNIDLNTLYCGINQLKALDLSKNVALTFLNCSNNHFIFSTLPQKEYDSYYYAPQSIMGGKAIVYSESLDLSSQYSITRNGNTAITNYKWYDAAYYNYEITSGITNNNGIFTFSQELAGKIIRCEMTNENFSGLTLIYNVALKQKASDNYFHEDDKEGLRVFLRQNNNFLKVYLLPTDTLTWNADENWVLATAGLAWGYESKDNHLISIEWSFWDGYRRLSGQLDAGKWSALMGLSLASNRITDLDVSKNTALTDLYCSSNQIKTLDVSKNIKLKYLYCATNQLTALEVNTNTLLSTLDCSSNQLETLDASKNILLSTLDCGNNNLTELDLSHNTVLTLLFCDNNHLLFSAIPPKADIMDYYGYAPQKTIQGGEIDYKSSIDLSKEYSIKGNITQFNWFDISAGDEQPITLNGTNGNFSLTEDFAGKTLRCKMANATFPDFGQTDDWGYFIPYMTYEVTIIKDESIGKGVVSGVEGQVYPNPTKGELRIKNYELKIQQIRVFDVMGRVMAAVETQGCAYQQNETTTLDISHLPAGMYFIQIQTEKGMITKKVVKQ